MWGEGESWVCGEGGWGWGFVEKGGGLGTRPLFAYNFRGVWHAGKDIFLDSILKREYIFWEF